MQTQRVRADGYPVAVDFTLLNDVAEEPSGWASQCLLMKRGFPVSVEAECRRPSQRRRCPGTAAGEPVSSTSSSNLTLTATHSPDPYVSSFTGSLAKTTDETVRSYTVQRNGRASTFVRRRVCARPSK